MFLQEQAVIVRNPVGVGWNEIKETVHPKINDIYILTLACSGHHDLVIQDNPQTLL